jgi:hypothetical protein
MLDGIQSTATRVLYAVDYMHMQLTSRACTQPYIGNDGALRANTRGSPQRGLCTVVGTDIDMVINWPAGLWSGVDNLLLIDMENMMSRRHLSLPVHNETLLDC